jgi:hypothetical protein
LFYQLADKLRGKRVLVQVHHTLGDGEVVWVRNLVVVEQVENKAKNLYPLVCECQRRIQCTTYLVS